MFGAGVYNQESTDQLGVSRRRCMGVIEIKWENKGLIVFTLLCIEFYFEDGVCGLHFIAIVSREGSVCETQKVKKPGFKALDQ